MFYSTLPPACSMTIGANV